MLSILVLSLTGWVPAEGGIAEPSPEPGLKNPAESPTTSSLIYLGVIVGVALLGLICLVLAIFLMSRPNRRVREAIAAAEKERKEKEALAAAQKEAEEKVIEQAAAALAAAESSPDGSPEEQAADSPETKSPAKKATKAPPWFAPPGYAPPGAQGGPFQSGQRKKNVPRTQAPFGWPTQQNSPLSPQHVQSSSVRRAPAGSSQPHGVSQQNTESSRTTTLPSFGQVPRAINPIQSKSDPPIKRPSTH